MFTKKIVSRTLVLALLSSVTACTQPGDTTGMGAAAGGVMGAGLGAIIGSQTGNAGAGLALGAVAGSGAGALIGNSLEAQQKAIRTQDEALERQQRIIQAQKAELDELRRSGVANDGAAPRARMANNFGGSSVSSSERERIRADYARAHPIRASEIRGTNIRNDRSLSERPKSKSVYSHLEEKIPAKVTKRAPVPMKVEGGSVESSFTGEKKKIEEAVDSTEGAEISRDLGLIDAGESEPSNETDGGRTAGIVEKDLTVGAKKDDTSEGTYDWSNPGSKSSSDSENTAGVKMQDTHSKECDDAAAEVATADAAQETADKLFHYRRALRLCPANAGYHNKLGEVYLKLKRPSDATYEFKEALKIDPSLVDAKNNLESLGR